MMNMYVIYDGIRNKQVDCYWSEPTDLKINKYCDYYVLNLFPYDAMNAKQCDLYGKIVLETTRKKRTAKIQHYAIKNIKG